MTLIGALKSVLPKEKLLPEKYLSPMVANDPPALHFVQALHARLR